MPTFICHKTFLKQFLGFKKRIYNLLKFSFDFEIVLVTYVRTVIKILTFLTSSTEII